MKKKLIRLTTVPECLFWHINGQLNFINKYFDVVVISSGGKYFEDTLRRESVRGIIIDFSRKISFYKDIKCLISLIKIFIKEKPLIVHSHTPKSTLLSMIAAYFTRVPHRIYTVTGLRFETTTGFLRYVLITMEKISCLCATKVIPEGEGVKKTLIKERITKKRMSVLLNGNINGINPEYYNIHSIDIDLIELKQSLGIDENHFIFCFVGRIVKDKGINELVSAFLSVNQQKTDTKLLLVGNFENDLDPVSESTLITIKSNKNIIHVGFQKDVRPYLAISNVHVFPSYREGFPNVVLQAGSMGLPNVVTDISGSNEIIEDGINGLIIPPRNEAKLLEAMEKVYSDNELICKFSENARKLIVQRYSQEKIWNAYLDMYNHLK